MAAQKKLEPGSKYASFDRDGDGTITDEEFEMEEKLMRMENEDKKQDAQRNMAWFALGGMLLYPAFVIAATLFNLDNAAKILGDMAAVYFVSVAAISIVSVEALVVIVTFEPAAKVRVSVVLSGDTVVCPDTAIFWK